jgi:hypothetical protein
LREHERNACAAALSLIHRKLRSRDAMKALARIAHARMSESTRRPLLATLARCPPFVKRIRCFFRCAVVIGAQCTRFATALFRYRHEPRLGGQYGEEGQEGEEGGEEDKA